MASDIWLRTILIVRKETRCRHIGYSYRLTARVLLYAPSHRQDSTYHGLCYTSRGALAGTTNKTFPSFCLVYNGFKKIISIPFRSVQYCEATGRGRDNFDSFSFFPVMRGYWTRKKYRPLIEERHSASVKLQSAFRGHMTRRKVKHERSAEQQGAVKIQRGEKGHIFF